ncbi:MAG: hypothetical protein NXI23_24165, partial [Bacteroidetes bacterium]|nr:hypothetical protein [Bacteroidota bacterium]
MHTKIYTRPFLLLLGVLVLFGFNDPKENDTPNNDSSIIQKESSSYFKKVLRDFKIEIAKTVSLNSSESEAKVYAMMGIIPPINMEIIPAGSYIINMGVEPQTKNNALKPYGLIWELLHDHLVPIKWAINADKIKDGVDFTYNNVDYKGGPFIVLAEYRSIAVNTVISTWEAQGVIGVTTTLDFIAPIDRTIN